MLMYVSDEFDAEVWVGISKGSTQNLPFSLYYKIKKVTKKHTYFIQRKYTDLF